MKRLALLAVLALAGCGPKPQVQAELCAILAQPGVPGVDQMGDAKALEAIDKRLQRSGRIYGPGLRLGTNVHSWGHCPKRNATVEMLLLKGGLAVTKGGLRAKGAQRTFGTCFYARVETGWRLLACRINGPS